MEPKDCIGKLIIFDSPTGSIFAEVVDAITFNTIQGPKQGLVVTNMLQCRKNLISEVWQCSPTSPAVKNVKREYEVCRLGGQRVVHWDVLSPENILGRDTDIHQACIDDEELFLQVLAAGSNKAPTGIVLAIEGEYLIGRHAEVIDE